MKLCINYDFFNAVLDVNEGFTPMKIVRNNKKIIGYWYLPVLTMLNYSGFKNLKDTCLLTILEFGIFLGTILSYNLITGIDEYKDDAKYNLKNLAVKLKDLYVKTDYDLLVKSELIKRKYKINIDEENVSALMELKYVLVPTYDFNGNIKDTCILQEHPVGTNQYVLSVGSPKKELKFAFANI